MRVAKEHPDGMIRTVRIPFDSTTDLVRTVEHGFLPDVDLKALRNVVTFFMRMDGGPSVSGPYTAGDWTEYRTVIEVEPGGRPMRSFVSG